MGRFTAEDSPGQARQGPGHKVTGLSHQRDVKTETFKIDRDRELKDFSHLVGLQPRQCQT